MIIREAIVPLPIDQIKEYFNDKSITFEIDYAKSKLKDTVFLTYLSNLDVPSDIKLSKDFDIEDTYKLIDAYMNISSISKIPFLEMIVAHILLRAVAVDTNEVLFNPFLTNEQVDKYIETRQDQVAKWVHFIDSTPLYLIYMFKGLNEVLEVENNFNVIDEAQYTGYNIVNMFNIPGFYNLYMTSCTSTTPMSFFKPQFTEYMFKGKSFFEYFNNKNNHSISMLSLAIEDKIPVDPKEIFGDIANG